MRWQILSTRQPSESTDSIVAVRNSAVKRWVRIATGIGAVMLAGLACSCGPWTFPAGYGRSYSIEPKKIGTGQQAVYPTNDPWHENGQALDLRRE